MSDATEQANGVYTDAERQIFTVWDGQKHVKRDPAKVRRKLFAALGTQSLDELLKQIDGPPEYNQLPPDVQAIADRQASDALDVLLPAICEAFGLRQLDDDGNGVTEAQALTAFNAFCNCMDALKKGAQSLPTGSPSPVAQADSA